MKTITAAMLKSKVEAMPVVPNHVSIPRSLGLGMPFDIGTLGVLNAAFAEKMTHGFKGYEDLADLAPVKAYGITADHNLVEFGRMSNATELRRAVQEKEGRIIAYMVHVYSAFTTQEGPKEDVLDVAEFVKKEGSGEAALKKMAEMGLDVKVGIISFVVDKYGMWSMAVASKDDIEIIGYSDHEGDIGVDLAGYGGPAGAKVDLKTMSGMFRGMFTETLTYSEEELEPLMDNGGESPWANNIHGEPTKSSLVGRTDNMLEHLKGMLEKVTEDPRIIEKLVEQDGDDNWRTAYIALQSLANLTDPKQQQQFLRETPLIVRKSMRDSLMRRVELLDESMKKEIH